MYKLLNFFGKNVVTSEGDEWRQHKKIVAPSFQGVCLPSFALQIVSSLTLGLLVPPLSCSARLPPRLVPNRIHHLRHDVARELDHPQVRRPMCHQPRPQPDFQSCARRDRPGRVWARHGLGRPGRRQGDWRVSTQAEGGSQAVPSRVGRMDVQQGGHERAAGAADRGDELNSANGNAEGEFFIVSTERLPSAFPTDADRRPSSSSCRRSSSGSRSSSSGLSIERSAPSTSTFA